VATLKAYYPRALEVCDDLKSAWARAFLRDYPTPAALTALTERRWQRWARAQRLSADRTGELWEIVQRPQLPVPPHVGRVHARRVAALSAELEVAIDAVQSYRQAVVDFFAALPAARWATSLPGGQSGITVPSLYAELGDAAGRWHTFRQLQAHGGAVPVTDRSGKHVSVRFRFACNRHLRHAAHQFAFQSLQQSDWARAYYARGRKRGQSHHHAVRALAAKWLKIIFVLWRRQVPYDETHHLATMARQQLRQAA
jgi:hypothetical protein